MFGYESYVPVLKWKMGEYQALDRLSLKAKERIVPLIEIPEVGFDYEKGINRETIDSHLGDFGKRLKQKWQARPCLVDLKFIDPATRMASGQHYVEAAFATARAEGCTAIPVVGLASDAAYKAAVAVVVAADMKGACIRVTRSDFDRPSLVPDILVLLMDVGVSLPDADLVIDLDAPGYLPISAHVSMIKGMLAAVPSLNKWRTVTVAGTAYPRTVSDLAAPFEVILRHEWITYKQLVSSLGDNERIPTFGDYAAAHPDLVQLDMRMIRPFAKLRYTIDDAWYIGRGATVRTHGFGQYQSMCQQLAAQPYFDGAPYSAGDIQIAGCAAGTATTGNLSTWVWVSTNRHLTRVADDLAKLHGI